MIAHGLLAHVERARDFRVALRSADLGQDRAFAGRKVCVAGQFVCADETKNSSLGFGAGFFVLLQDVVVAFEGVELGVGYALRQQPANDEPQPRSS